MSDTAAIPDDVMKLAREATDECEKAWLYEADAKTPPVAIILAMLTALKALRAKEASNA